MISFAQQERKRMGERTWWWWVLVAGGVPEAGDLGTWYSAAAAAQAWELGE